MGLITADKLKVSSIYSISQVLDMEIAIESNQHGRLVLRGYLKENEAEMKLVGSDSGIKISELNEKGEGIIPPIFHGVIQDTHIYSENGMKQIIITALSGSILLDKEKKSRSFQEASMTYGEVVK